MDFAFTPAQEQLQKEIRAWAERELAPSVWLWEDADELPWEGVRKMADAGLLGFTLPERVGGLGRGFVDFAVVLEELGRIGGGLWTIPYFNNLYGRIIDDEAFLRGLVRGENVIAFAETEPHSGGDAAAIRTTAVRDGDEYVIDGAKTHISLVPGANWVLVTALTDPAAPSARRRRRYTGRLSATKQGGRHGTGEGP